MDVDISDCYVDEKVDLYTPAYYRWSYTGSNDTDDNSIFLPVYRSEPTLTKLEICNLVAFEEELDINNPINFAN
jgi:hypothetical protein